MVKLLRISKKTMMRVLVGCLAWLCSVSAWPNTEDRADVARPLNSELRPSTKRSPAYLSQVGGHIKRFIVYVAKNGEERALNPMARFNIKLSPAGEVQSVRLIQTSGFKNWDLTAARAIEKSSPLPLPEEGGPPEEIELLIQPKDDR